MYNRRTGAAFAHPTGIGKLRMAYGVGCLGLATMATRGIGRDVFA